MNPCWIQCSLLMFVLEEFTQKNHVFKFDQILSCLLFLIEKISFVVYAHHSWNLIASSVLCDS